VPQDVARELSKGKKRRPHRTKGVVGGLLKLVVTRASPIDVCRINKPMGNKEQTDVLENLMRVSITCNIFFKLHAVIGDGWVSATFRYRLAARAVMKRSQQHALRGPVRKTLRAAL